MATKKKLVFVYGTLREGGKLSGVMHQSGAALYGVGRILNRDFVMRDLGSYPALQKVDSGSGDYITGELWLIPVAGIENLDTVENYPRFYNRMSVDVWAGEPTESFSAIVYYIDTEVSKGGNYGVRNYLTQSPVIKSGEWDPYENRPVMGHSSEGSEPVTTVDIDEGFVCNRGIYITSEWGEMYGPYEDIEEACGRIPALVKEMKGEARMFTVGFRVRRKDLDMEDLVDLDNNVMRI